MRGTRFSVLTTWILVGLVCAAAIYDAASSLAGIPSAAHPISLVGEALLALFPILFSIPAALIITRQPLNLIGWLLMTPALAAALTIPSEHFLDLFPTSAPPLPFPFLFAIMFVSDAAWIGLIFPLLLIPLFFPTGQLLAQRWRWVIYLAAALLLTFFLQAAFSKTYQPDNIAWAVTIPWGFITAETAARYFFPPWIFLLVTLTIASLSSILVRYRRSDTVEREQIKWFLYACALFTLVYVPTLFFYNAYPTTQAFEGIANLVFLASVAMIPAAITIAILRYRLFDIDVIIRLTVVYALVTGLLGVIYAAEVIMLQAAFRALTGQSSEFAVVITTLGIAALFNPLRARIQGWIDRRFYRKKYDAEQALAAFAAASRNISSLDTLTEMMAEVVQNNLQPSFLSLHIRPYKTPEKK